MCQTFSLSNSFPSNTISVGWLHRIQRIAHHPTTHHSFAFLPTKSCACYKKWSNTYRGIGEFKPIILYQCFQILCEIRHAKINRVNPLPPLYRMYTLVFLSWICLCCRFTFVGVLFMNIFHNKIDTFDEILSFHIPLKIHLRWVKPWTIQNFVCRIHYAWIWSIY